MTSGAGTFVHPWLTTYRVRLNNRAVIARKCIINTVPRPFVVIVIVIDITLVNFIGRLAHRAWRSCSRRPHTFRRRRDRDIRRLIGQIGFLQIHHFRTRGWRIAELNLGVRFYSCGWHRC